MYLSTSQKTGESLNRSLTDEGKFRVSLSPMFALSYKISLDFSYKCSFRCWKHK